MVSWSIPGSRASRASPRNAEASLPRNWRAIRGAPFLCRADPDRLKRCPGGYSSQRPKWLTVRDNLCCGSMFPFEQSASRASVGPGAGAATVERRALSQPSPDAIWGSAGATKAPDRGAGPALARHPAGLYRAGFYAQSLPFAKGGDESSARAVGITRRAHIRARRRSTRAHRVAWRHCRGLPRAAGSRRCDRLASPRSARTCDRPRRDRGSPSDR